MPKGLKLPHVEPGTCFLNIPYDKRFEKLYLAYIVGLTALGFLPRATLGVPRDARRLERIFNLIQSCEYSVHDLSRIELDRKPPRSPRFNMPFELGLAVAWATLNRRQHQWVYSLPTARTVGYIMAPASRAGDFAAQAFGRPEIQVHVVTSTVTHAKPMGYPGWESASPQNGLECLFPSG